MMERKSIRLTGYDYAQSGSYFVTICTQGRVKMFWEGKSVGQGLCPCLSLVGEIAEEEIKALSKRFPSVVLDKYVVMADHIHLLLTMERQGQSPCPTLGEVIGAYKSITTKRINRCMSTPGQKVWQARFYDHVIRDENDFLTKWNYIDTNPLNGEESEEGQCTTISSSKVRGQITSRILT